MAWGRRSDVECTSNAADPDNGGGLSDVAQSEFELENAGRPQSKGYGMPADERSREARGMSVRLLFEV